MTGFATRGRTHGRVRSRAALIAVVLALGGSSALLAGCASQPEPPQSMRDPQANFSAYETFGWTSGAPEGADAPLKLLDNNLRTAIAAELQRRGYVEAPAGATPDLKITYDAASSDKIKNNPVRVGIGVGGWGGGNVGGSVGVSSPSVQSYKEGTLVVHAVDTARNAEVWQGRVSGKLTQGSLEPEAINRAVAAAMQDFPARSAGQ